MGNAGIKTSGLRKQAGDWIGEAPACIRRPLAGHHEQGVLGNVESCVTVMVLHPIVIPVGQAVMVADEQPEGNVTVICQVPPVTGAVPTGVDPDPQL
jgi:hypothetical protein